MPRSSLPARDQAGFSPRAKDHLHELRTKFTRLDLLSLCTDLMVSLLGSIAVASVCMLTALGFIEVGFLAPQELMPMRYGAALWLILCIFVGFGVAGLSQFWLRRIWVQTYGTRGRWSVFLGSQLFLGAVMPLVSLKMLISGAGPVMSVWGGGLAVMALLYLRHAFQVYRWAFS